MQDYDYVGLGLCGIMIMWIKIMEDYHYEDYDYVGL